MPLNQPTADKDGIHEKFELQVDKNLVPRLFTSYCKLLSDCLKYFIKEGSFLATYSNYFYGFSKCFHILWGLKAFQSSRNCFKYSEKQIGFSHGNFYNLSLSNSSPANVAFYTKQDSLTTSTPL